MVCKEVCTGLDLFTATTDDLFMWITFSAITATMISYFIFNPERQFDFDQSHMKFNPNRSDFTHYDRAICYEQGPETLSGAEMASKEIKKKWMNTDGSWKERAIRVARFPQSITGTEVTERKQRSNPNTNASNGTASRVMEFTVKVKPTFQQLILRQPKLNSKNKKVYKVRIFQTKSDMDDFVVQQVPVSDKKKNENSVGTELDGKQQELVNARPQQIGDELSVRQQVETGRRRLRSERKHGKMRGRCSGPKNGHVTDQESARQMVKGTDGKKSLSRRDIPEEEHRGSPCDSNRRCKFDSCRLNRKVFRTAAMAYYNKNKRTSLAKNEYEDNDMVDWNVAYTDRNEELTTTSGDINVADVESGSERGSLGSFIEVGSLRGDELV